MLAEIENQKSSTAYHRAQTARTEKLTPAELAREQAATRASDALTTQRTEMLAYEKRQADANIEQSLAAAGASNVSAARIRNLYPKEIELLDKQMDEYVKMKVDGKEFSAKGMDLIKERTDIIEKLITREKDKAANIRQLRLDDQKALKESSEAEVKLKTLAEGPYPLKPEEITPIADLHHALSKKGYVYILEPDPYAWQSKGETSYRKLTPISLPKVDGHQYTAQEVYDKATLRGMSTQEYMEKVFYPGLRQAVPWYVTSEPK